MRRPDVRSIVYSHLFPHPSITDPRDFAQHIARNVVPEVRHEIMRFYGAIDSLESQYPGLDYARPAHRLRLSHFTWHRRLFRAFDALGLSHGEIYALCTWEGTLYAKDRYEKETGILVRDTTWDGIAALSPSHSPVAFSTSTFRDRPNSGHARRSPPRNYYVPMQENSGMEGMEYGEAMEESDDDLIANSYGNELNRRLLAGTAARARGEEAVLDPAWEQWLKDAVERGHMLPYLAPAPPRHHQQRQSTFSARWSNARGHSEPFPETFRYYPPSISQSHGGDNVLRRTSTSLHSGLPPISRFRANTHSGYTSSRRSGGSYSTRSNSRR